MKTILYLMHIPWGWIKQRPHFLAENLAAHYGVRVFCKKSYRKRNLVGNPEPTSVHVKQLFVLPYDKSPLIALANSRLMKLQLNDIVKFSDIIWLTHPALFSTIAGTVLPSAPLVYDCMDDALNFPAIKHSKRNYQMIAAAEKNLCDQSRVIFASSQNLKTKLIERYHVDKNKITVINNAINLKVSNFRSNALDKKVINAFSTTKTKLVYIGTISEWFDFELILQSLTVFEQIEYLLIGPIEVQIPQHERITCLGPVDHSCIFQIMGMSDILIMPFKITELVLSVNPVKLYEYIYSNRPALAVRYTETLPFEDYVHLYSTPDEFNDCIRQLLSGCSLVKKGVNECREFLGKNDWQSRVNQIQGILSNAC